MALLCARPIMYYRPDSPAGRPYLRVTLRPGGNAKKAGNLMHVSRCMLGMPACVWLGRMPSCMLP